jgi:hypothetical protein
LEVAGVVLSADLDRRLTPTRGEILESYASAQQSAEQVAKALGLVAAGPEDVWLSSSIGPPAPVHAKVIAAALSGKLGDVLADELATVYGIRIVGRTEEPAPARDRYIEERIRDHVVSCPPEGRRRATHYASYASYAIHPVDFADMAKRTNAKIERDPEGAAFAALYLAGAKVIVTPDPNTLMGTISAFVDRRADAPLTDKPAPERYRDGAGPAPGNIVGLTEADAPRAVNVALGELLAAARAAVARGDGYASTSFIRAFADLAHAADYSGLRLVFIVDQAIGAQRDPSETSAASLSTRRHGDEH